MKRNLINPTVQYCNLHTAYQQQKTGVYAVTFSQRFSSQQESYLKYVKLTCVKKTLQNIVFFYHKLEDKKWKKCMS